MRIRDPRRLGSAGPGAPRAAGGATEQVPVAPVPAHRHAVLGARGHTEGADGLARHTHNRSQRYRNAGFTYRAEHDHWVCPEDQLLWPHSYDSERRLVRYRAKPHICNACPTKHLCTTSSTGREVVRPIDPWPHSEAGRFHRIVALVLVTLAGLLTAVELARWHDPADLVPLAAAATLTAAAAWWLTGHLRATPTNFPAPSPSASLRFTTRTGRANHDSNSTSGRNP